MGLDFVHVFSFGFEGVSVGRFSSVPVVGFPVFRRVSGGGVVFHGPRRDIDFAFSLHVDLVGPKEIFESVSKRICVFLERVFGVRCFYRGGEIFGLFDSSNVNKICGMAGARNRELFVVEGCIMLRRDGGAKGGVFCFEGFGEEIGNFHRVCGDLLEFLIEGFRDLR